MTTAEQLPTEREGATVLICEDEQLVALELAEWVEEVGHRVLGVAHSGTAALQLAMSERPDIALLDIQLEEGLSGIDVGRMLRSELGVPSIYLTGYGDLDTLAEASRSEPLAYLVKPVRDSELLAAIEVGLQLHRRQKDLEVSMLQSELRLQQALEALKITATEEAGDLLAVTGQEREFEELLPKVAHRMNNSVLTVATHLELLSRSSALPVADRQHLLGALAGCEDLRQFTQRLFALCREVGK